LASFSAGRRGRMTSSPPQFGQWPLKRDSVQSSQKVHSKEQMRAIVESGGRSRSQHSQLGRSCRMGGWGCEIASILQVLAGNVVDKWFADDSQMKLAIVADDAWTPEILAQ
jgi:hypothetical protein